MARAPKKTVKRKAVSTRKSKVAVAPERWADNIVALAAALGVSRQTIYNWQKIEGCPTARANGKYQVEEWAKFGALVSSQRLDAPDATEKAQLEARRLKIQCEKLEWEFACARQEWTPNETIAVEILRLVNEARVILTEELDAKASPDVRKFNRAGLDRAFARLHRGGEQIAAKYPAP